MADNLRVDDDQQLPLDLTKDKPAAQAAAPADETVEELKRQIADRDAKTKAALETAEAERKARIEAEQRAGNAAHEVEQYKTQAQTAEQKAVANYLDAENRESESAQRELEAALNSGDYANVGKIQAKIAKSAARIVQLENAKAHIDAQVANPQQVRVDVSQRQGDPTEQFLAAQNPRIQAMIRQYPEMVVQKNGRPDFSPTAWRAHHAALGQGYSEGSEEYFQHINDSVAPQRQAAEDDDGYQQPAPRRAAPVAAPVSRETPGNNSRSNTKHKLSAEEADIARISGMTPQQYWENKQALTAEGRIGRTTH